MRGAAVIATVVAVVVFSAVALADTAFGNFGPHGAFSLDTDACAGCHRAHSAVSPITWLDSHENTHSALLLSPATTLQEFCYACHGDGAPGAGTNVVHGIFDSGPSGPAGVPVGGSILFTTNSSLDATLNGGGFDTLAGGDSVTSIHTMEAGAATDPMWGAGNSAPSGQNLDCVSCHDPHGSSNYRLLKDIVNGVTVGGYTSTDTPQPFVYSAEENYPGVGWLRHEPGVLQMAAYKPNYTGAEYRWETTATYTGGRNRSMSTWCSACHTQYSERGDAVTGSAPYDYGTAEAAANNGALLGPRSRHRHPVDLPIDSVSVAAGWGADTVTSTALPLEKRPGAAEPRGTWTREDYLGCLTCHYAHGTAASMSGWANARLRNNPSGTPSWTIEPTSVPAPKGVNPNFSSSLLRMPNRGVCERCHNK